MCVKYKAGSLLQAQFRFLYYGFLFFYDWTNWKVWKLNGFMQQQQKKSYFNLHD